VGWRRGVLTGAGLVERQRINMGLGLARYRLASQAIAAQFEDVVRGGFSPCGGNAGDT